MNQSPEVRYLHTVDLPGSDFTSVVSATTTLGSNLNLEGSHSENTVLVTSTTKILKVRVDDSDEVTP